MKKIYGKPQMMCEQYEANEYVAGCGDKGTSYKFECDKSSNSWFTDSGTVYLDSNSNGEFDLLSDRRITALYGYHPCEKGHISPTDDEYLDGFVVTITGGAQPVKIWTEGGTNVHCTGNVDMATWETTKS